MSAPLFPVLPALAAGFRHLKNDWLFLSALIAFPIFINFMILVGLDFFSADVTFLWAAVAKVPGDFVKGVFLALYIRYLLFRDTPPVIAKNPEAQRHVAISTLIYTTFSLVSYGILGGLAHMTQDMQQDAAPSVGALIASGVGLMAVLWLFRYQFLPIAAAAGYSLRNFISFLGHGFALPIRILALYVLASLPAFFILSLVGEILAVAGGFESLAKLQGPTMWLFLLCNAAVAVLTSIIQVAASVHAIKHGMKGQNDHV